MHPLLELLVVDIVAPWEPQQGIKRRYIEFIVDQREQFASKFDFFRVLSDKFDGHFWENFGVRLVVVSTAAVRGA